MSSTQSSAPQAGPLPLDQLRAEFDGRLLAPGDDGYDRARTIFVGGLDRRPAVVIRPAGPAEVARGVALARETGRELAVRAGGHSTAGYGATDGGVMLDLSGMRALEIDPDGRTAWAEGGLTTGAYTTAAGRYGLATGFGDTATVGVGGLTLGGGVGFLSRRFGLTVDDLLAAEIVTADGEVRRVNAEQHPDLFWAIRGGGGNFGVVTRFQFRLHPVDRVTGGMLILPATAETIAGYVAAVEAAPEELSAIANVMVAPPMPFLPSEVHGERILMIMPCYSGDPAGAERALAPLRAVAPPLVDGLHPTSYPEIFEGPPGGDDYHPTLASRTFFVDECGTGTATTLLDQLGRATTPMAMVQLRVLGGAVARVPDDATAYAHRTRRVMVVVNAIYQDPAGAAAHEEWASQTADLLSGGDRRAYANFLGAEPAETVREAYPGATWDRLRQVKGRYDPTNLFRLNQNIPPA